ncbi:gliding motility-associated C-terminal domain-containing protein [Chryseobacterium piscicola]|uniref:Gliding motility-associated C-terminal domain-containing protein n=1 Tax=Chryseobacterium piscicola TaxID=551459 RepID=A0A1N7MY13_9FLAO|nr:gliding motility-associated C-terminal domain-containing protein [Chryseobacterium piscicola]
MHSQNLLWDFHTTGPIIQSQHFLQYSTTDSQGNIYIGGSYGLGLLPSVNAITFGNITKTSAPLVGSTAVIAKLDKNKNVIWVKEIKSKVSSRVSSLIVDHNDNLIIAGITDGADLKLNPNSDTIYPTGSNQDSSFIVKLDSNGNFVFGNIYVYAYNISCSIDSNNNIISSGNYASYAPLFFTDFNPDPSITFNLPAPNGIFVMKNNPDGSFVWARPLHAHNTPSIQSIKVDNNNDIIIHGNYEAYLKIDNNTYSSGSNSNRYFLVKFNNNGGFLWFQRLSSFSFHLGTSGSKIDVDSSNNIYTASTFVDPQSIVFPNKTINIAGGGGQIVYKINSNGNLNWNSIVKGNSAYVFLSIKLNTDNTINFLVKDTGDILKVTNGNDNTEETIHRMNLGINYSYLSNDSKAYFLKYRNDGKLIFNKSDFSSSLYSQNIDFEGNIVLAGYFDDHQDFNPDQDIKDIEYNHNDINGLIQKFGKCYNGTPDGNKTQTFCSSLNPKISNLQPNTSYTTWYDSPFSTIALPPNTLLQNNVTYYASVQDESCPLNPKRLPVLVIIKQSPTALNVNDFYFCSNVNQMTFNQLNINNNQNIRFYDANGNLLSNYSYILPGVQYYVAQYNQECESTKTPFKVFSLQNTGPTANSPQTFCTSDLPTVASIQISGQNIKWYDSSGNLLSATTPLIIGQTYYASQTINGCESIKTAIQITVNNTPLPTANTNQDFCASANPTLVNLIINGTSLIFYDAAGNVLPLTTPLVNGQIYYVSQTLNGCQSEKLAITVTLSQNNVPANNYRETLCNVTTANTMIVNLNSYQSNLIVNPANYIFTYTNQAGNPILNPATYILNPGSNIINVKVATSDGCFKNVILELVLNPKPSVTLPEDFDFCEGKSAILDAGSGFTSYIWNTGATTQTITVSTAGTYSVKVTNSFGCENTDSIVLSYSTLAQITAVNITGNTTTVVVSTSGNYEYSLDNISWQDSNIFTQLEMGEYTVYVRTKDGCFIGQKPFSIFNIPNAISPNGDGVNDTWKIAGLQNYKGSEVSVYDRKGALVFRQIINKTDLKWDGKIQGAAVPTGNYWYIIKVSDGRNYNGWLLIKNRN